VPGAAGKSSTANELNDISDDLKLWSNKTLPGDVTTISGGDGVSEDTKERKRRRGANSFNERSIIDDRYDVILTVYNNFVGHGDVKRTHSMLRGNYVMPCRH
jgi:hypothetical protein